MLTKVKSWIYNEILPIRLRLIFYVSVAGIVGSITKVMEGEAQRLHGVMFAVLFTIGLLYWVYKVFSPVAIKIVNNALGSSTNE